MSNLIQEGKQDLKNSVGNILTIGTGTLSRGTRLAKNTMNETFDIADQTINTTGVLGKSALKTTGVVGKSALDATGSVGEAGIKTGSQVSVDALKAVGDGVSSGISGLTGIGKGANRIGNITGNSAKASLERFRVRNEGKNLRNDKLTQYRENEKTEDLYSDLKALSESGKNTRIYREEIIGKCINDIGNKKPPPKDYPLNKRGDHCKRMVNCKVYGKQENKKKFGKKVAVI